MPSLKEGRAATFEPIPPNLNVAELVGGTENFRYVDRFPASLLDDPERFESIVRNWVIIGGEPMVIEGLQHKLAPWLYNPAWLEQNLGEQVAMIRDLEASQDQAWTIGHYLRNMSTFTKNFKPMRYDKGQRLYLKDMDVPDQWHNNLKDILPPFLYYYNDGTGEYGGPGAVDDTHGVRGRGRGVAASGDLMSSLPDEFRAVNMLCYVGHEGTYTPAHREMCGSLGQNIMVETSTSIDINGNPSAPGSSLWFMTKTTDRFLVSEYWMSSLGHDIEVESHFASIDAWRRAPFTTYVVEQRVGDFILIPPLAPHQVWNRGTRTMKAAWNRTTVETLELAMSEAVPRARLVCRDEAYKNKSIIYYTLDKYASLLRRVGVGAMMDFDERTAHEIRKSKKVRQLKRDFIRLFKLFNDIMLSETFSPSLPQPTSQRIPYQSDVVCSYCRCNIFNRFLTCKECSLMDDEGGEDDDYDVCMDCFAMGRSCWCLSKQKWVEQWKWTQLTDKHEEWRSMVIEIQGIVNEESPQKLEEARGRLGKKTLAAVCQEQLKIRRKAKRKDPALDNPVEEEPIVKEDGYVKRRKTRKSSGILEDSNCHVCKVRHDNWKMAHCGCGKSYCYGNLYRAFDLLPMDIMEQVDWKCPFCLGICSCGQCRKDGRTKPYEPKLTCLGHDTKKIADPRSVESLVDFSRSNLIWLRSTAASGGSNETARLKNIKEQAERDNPSAGMLDTEENYHEAGDIQDLSMIDAPHELESTMSSGIPIDPLLEIGQSDSHAELNSGHPEPNPPSGLHHRPYEPLFHGGENQYGRDNLFLPLPARMIIDPQPIRRYQSPSEGGPTPYGALPSFTSMGGPAMSGLEHDPHGFIAAAGLSPIFSSQPAHLQQPASSFVAPAATMISQRPEHDGYEGGNSDYPKHGGSQHQYPCVRDTAGAEDEAPSKKRKRKSSNSAIQSDVPGSLNDAQHQFEQAQWHSTLQKAKRDGNFYSVRARRENKHLIIKFPISQERLSSIMQGNAQNQPSPSFDGSHDERSQVLVTSDLAPNTANFRALALANTEFSSTNRPPSGSPVGREELSAFTRKRRGRPKSTRSSLPPPKPPKGYRKPAKSWNGLSEGSADEESARVSEISPKNGEELAPKKVRASAWLFRKNQDEPANLPTELPTPQRTKRSQNRKQSSPVRGLNGKDTGKSLEINHNSDDSEPTTPSDGAIRKSHGQPDMSSKAPLAKRVGPTSGAKTRAAVDPATPKGESAAAKAYREGKLIAMRLAEGEISEISSDSEYSSATEENPPRAKVIVAQQDSTPTPKITKKAAIQKSVGPLPSRLQGKNIRIISAKEAERRMMASSAPPPRVEKPGVPAKASRSSMPVQTTIVDLSGGYSDSDSQSPSFYGGIPSHPKVSPLFSKTKGQKYGLKAAPHVQPADEGRPTSNRTPKGRPQKVLDDREEGLFGEDE
ncbi:MAG: hypothetical protein M1840_006124 [Geoglossum simile]|nr:MAG: hypothetical protein M1840_006124 [Geoglossum simile]